MNKRAGISSFSILLIMSVLAIAGLAAANVLKVQYSPSIPQNSITVFFSYPGASAYTVEAEVTSRLEGLMSNVTSVSAISSVSYEGSGNVSILFNKHVDMAAARFEVASYIRNIYPKLPAGVTYPNLSLNVSGKTSSIALSYDIKSNLSTKEIEHFVKERIIPPLTSLDGVEWINLSGVTPYEWTIIFDTALTKILGITADDVCNAFLQHFSKNIIGLTEDSGMSYTVRLETDVSDEFGGIPIKKCGSRIIYLKDIATYQLKEAEPEYYFRLNGLNTVNLSIGISPSANLISSANNIKERMEHLQAMYPEELSSSLSYDTSEYISKELDKIYFRTLLCLLLLLGFTFMVNRSWKYMLIIAITIATDILVAMAIYWLTGLRIHIYTMAGITVSLGIIIDSAIIMTNHYSRYRNRNAFPALLCAVITTIAALMVILLLPDRERANLTDFISVIVINLSVSLITAYLFVPALLDYIKPVSGRHHGKSARKLVRWNSIYEKYIIRGQQHRWIYIIILIISFGIPTALLPDRIGSENPNTQKWHQKIYNTIIGWAPYAENRSVIDKILGTSFALFNETLHKSNFYREPSRQVLSIRAAMPEGCSTAQMNEVMKSMENYISQYPQIDYFITQIQSHDNAGISVYFKTEYENTEFPAKLKADVISMATNLGGATWNIFGITESYFNNNVTSYYKSNRIILTGYNYNDLLKYANTLLDYLNQNRRVSGAEIWGAGYASKPITEYHVRYDFSALTAMNVNPYIYYSALYTPLYNSMIGNVQVNGEYVNVRLQSSDKDKFDLWHILNSTVKVDSTAVKLAQIGDITAQQSGLTISRNNQSYEINIVFDFIGSYELNKRITNNALKYMNDSVLPVGYKAYVPWYGGWADSINYRNAGLIGLIIILILIICAIFFESIRLPFSIILMIPVSFIGLFLTFGLSGITFDQGGLAAFIMLAGISVNAGIYLIYEFRQIDYGATLIKKYIRAFNRKIIPVLLTIISTILGLIPFLFDGPEEVFWFDFAAGTIGGLIFSLIALVLYLPIFCIRKQKPNINNHRITNRSNETCNL